MDTRAFLEALWPPQGIYCLATPFKPGDADRSTFAHYTASSIDEFLRKVDALRSRDNVFFCVHTLKAERVWNPTKRDRKTGKLGAWERRTHSNMHEARCFFFDLDVGESTPVTPKYKTRQEALDGLDQFLFRTRLPDPLVASSGGGFHVYWRLTEAIGSVEWRQHATVLRHIARREGLRADPARTNDQSSVLRVVGTSNIKPGYEPRPCVALEEGVETSTGSFLGQLRDLLGQDTLAPESLAHVGGGAAVGNLQKVWDGPTPTLEEVSEVCEHVRTYVACGLYARGEPILYHLGCGVLSFMEDGLDHYEDFASTHPDYHDLGAVQAKLDQYNDQTGGMPSSCAILDAKCGGDACSKCAHHSLGKNPLLIACEARKRKALPPPTLNLNLGVAQPMLIVEPGFPYTRTQVGVCQTVTKKDADGVEFKEEVLVSSYDMFPFEACERTELERAFTMWAIEVPKVGQVVIKITSPMMQDIRLLHQTLEDYGVHVTRKQVDKVMDYMLHYAKVLQKSLRANRQYDHLGWADKEHTQFILPNTLLLADGSQAPCTTSGVVKDVAGTIHTHGTLAEQIELLRYYNADKYLHHQFVVLCGLASPAFHVTDFAGVVVNAAGETGAGKSSALYTAAGLWGYPSDYVINGTKTGMTLLGQAHKVFTLSNLPVCVDEITNCEDKEVRDFVFGSTQPKERGGLLPNGQPRAVRETYKSTIYLCSSNKSFHNLLGQSGEVGNASSMRVFELWFESFKTGKVEAQEHMHGVLRNYGWVGPAVLERYVRHRQYVDDAIRTVMAKMDRKHNLTGPERFWSGTSATALTYGEFGAQLGFIPFNIPRLREWFLDEQLPKMRGDIHFDEASHDAQMVLGAFLQDIQGKTLVTASDVSMSNQFPITDPRGAVVAECDKLAQVIHVRKDIFRHWLGEQHHNALKTFGDLTREKVITATDVKRTLGAGTTFARGRALCFTVDLTRIGFSGDMPAANPVPVSNVVPLRRKP